MVPPYVRQLMFMIAITIGISLFFAGNAYASVAIGLAAMIAYGHFRFGSVMLAFRAVQAERYDRAERLLKRVRFPNLLTMGQRFYFELASGAVAGYRDQLDVEEEHYRIALTFSANNERDRSVVELELAELLAERGANAEALEFLELARDRQCTPSVMKGIEELTVSLNATDNQS